MAKMPKDWPLAEAKARFSELVGFVEENGPQYVTKRGKRTVVMVPVGTWEKLNADPSDRDAIAWLLAPEARIEDLQIPDRTSFKWRKGAKVR